MIHGFSTTRSEPPSADESAALQGTAIRPAANNPHPDDWQAGFTVHKAERTLLCVCFVDVVGFSAMMQAEEAATFTRWTGLRDGLVLPLLTEFGGTLVKSTGDGILATFRDPVDAVRWSRELQIRARQRRQSLALRVSLNYCNVLRDGSDLLGNGVNIAARLQDFAAAGGVILTEAVQERIARLAEFEMRSLGALKLRNIASAVRAFELVTDGRYQAEAVPGPAQLPTIAVMPFDSPAAADEYFASGIAEDIAQRLSRHSELTVVSRSSTLAFARQDFDPRTVGEALGVAYLIAGRLRRCGSRLRISAELLDTEHGQILASLRREFEEAEMFAVQDEIVETALAHLLPEMLAAERRRSLRKWPSSLTAYDDYLRALDLMGGLERDPFEQARTYLDRAIEADPGFSAPLAWAARWHTLRIGQGWSSDKRADAQQAAELAKRAIRIDETDALALATFGHVHSYLFGDFDAALEYLDRARAANPSSSIAWLLGSVTLSSVGRHEEAIAAAERALRLSPFDQRLFIHYAFLGTVHYDAGHPEEAVRWLSRSLVENPRYTSALRTLAVAQVAAGQVQHARQTMARLLALEPGFSLDAYRKDHRHYRDTRASDLFCARLSDAGAPD